MATAKKTTKPAPATKAAKAKTPAATVIRPIKDTFTKGALTNHLSELSGVEPKAVKAVLAALETTVLGAVNKKGAGEFTLPGLLKNPTAITIDRANRIYVADYLNHRVEVYQLVNTTAEDSFLDPTTSRLQ